MKRTSVILAVTVLLSTSTQAQTIVNHVSPNTISKVTIRFEKSYTKSGMSGVVDDIRSCYAATTDGKTIKNQMAVVECLLYDYSALVMNKDMSNAMVAEGFPGNPDSAIPYLTDRAWEARLAIYVPIPFGDNTSAFGPYFGDAPDKIATDVMNNAAKQ